VTTDLDGVRWSELQHDDGAVLDRAGGGPGDAGSRRILDLAGLRRHGAARSVLSIVGNDGCFAECVTLPVRNLDRVPDGLPDPSPRSPSRWPPPAALTHDLS
jgi:hypothetical protein